MDDTLLTESNHKLDSKGRIIIPLKFRSIGKEISLINHNDIYIKIYSLKILKNKIEQIKKDYCNTYDAKLKKYYDMELDLLVLSIMDITYIDLQNRFTIKNNIRNKFKIEHSVLLNGGLDHIKMFNNSKNKQLYLNELRSKHIR